MDEQIQKLEQEIENLKASLRIAEELVEVYKEIASPMFRVGAVLLDKSTSDAEKVTRIRAIDDANRDRAGENMDRIEKRHGPLT